MTKFRTNRARRRKHSLSLALVMGARSGLDDRVLQREQCVSSRTHTRTEFSSSVLAAIPQVQVGYTQHENTKNYRSLHIVQQCHGMVQRPSESSKNTPL